MWRTHVYVDLIIISSAHSNLCLWICPLGSCLYLTLFLEFLNVDLRPGVTRPIGLRVRLTRVNQTRACHLCPINMCQSDMGLPVCPIDTGVNQTRGV